MEENRNALGLAKNLLESGFKDVRFFDDLSYHPTVQQLITNQKLIDSNQIALMCSNQNPAIINQNGYPNLAQQTINSGFQLQNSQLPRSTFPLSTSTGSSSTASTTSPFSTSPQLIPPMDPNTFLHHMYAQAPPVQTIPNVTVMPMPTPMPVQKIQMSQSQLSQLLQNLGVGSPVAQAPGPYKRKEEPLPEEIVNCHKCSAQINITRYSNLMTHVRKHCELKMFQCPECTFSSNAGQKVAQHMRSLHKLLGDPITRSHQEIQPVLEQLTRECFPTYGEQLAKVRAFHTQQLTQSGENRMRKRKSLWDEGMMPQTAPNLPVVTQPPPNPPPSNMMTYHCYGCRKKIKCVIGQELSPDGPLITHLRMNHTLECMPYKCEACGWMNTTEWKVRRHIIVRHTENAAHIGVLPLRKPNWKLFLTKKFAEMSDILSDDQEDLECEKLERQKLHPDFLKRIAQINSRSLISEMIGTELPKKRSRKNQNPVKIQQEPSEALQMTSKDSEAPRTSEAPMAPEPIVTIQNPPKASESIVPIQNPPESESTPQNPTEIQNFMKAYESKVQNPSGIQNFIKDLEKPSESKIQNPPSEPKPQNQFWIESLPLSSESKIQIQNPPPKASEPTQEAFWIQNLPLSSESAPQNPPEPQKYALYVPKIDPNVITID